MSVQLKSDAHSNTGSKSRQPRQEDALEFLSLIDQIGTTGKFPDSYGNIGRYKEYVDLLIEGLDQDGLEGFKKKKTYILNKEKSLASLYAIHQADQDQAAEQEELHPDFRIGKQGKKVFKTLSEDDIEDFPDSESMVSGLLQAASVSELYSESNTGKTFIALDIAEHIARGMSWLGRKVKQGPVLYIYAESRLGLKPRILAWKKHHNLPSTPNLQFITRPVQLVNDRQMLLDTLAEQEVTPELVVVDTFSNCAEGINQNDQAEVYRVLATAHELVREYGCHVMVVHHTNKSGSANGSAAFKNHVDTMIELKRADKYSPIIMHCEKQRDTEQFDDIILQLQVVNLYVNLETLEPVTSCVVISSDAPTNQERAAAETDMERQNMLDLLKLHKRLSVNKWIAACKDIGISKRAFYDQIRYIKAEKLVTWEDKGSGRGIYFELAAVSVEQASLGTGESDG